MLRALDAAEVGLNRVLALDAIFGEAAIGPPFVADQMHAAISLCQELRVRVPEASIPPIEAAVKVAEVSHVLNLISTTITIYHQLRYHWLTFEHGLSQSVGVLGF